MPTRTGEAEWKGDVQHGSGVMKVGSGAFEGHYGLNTRMGDEKGTNPEELIGAAHAGCFSMALSAALTKAGFPPDSIHTTAKVHFDQKDGNWTIHTIELSTEAEVPKITAEAFEEQAQGAKKNCPVSRALAGVPEITLDAKLI
ncbi:MAG TPA: OsmC family protein [Rhizomicrobium sp.]|jgi:osmotically inducible protein OsmC|nr:OsmC family protein [Rhizomicrobium sp.]HEX4534552.1 OsmC family protein [Rhizomicrobium sp.]